MKELKKADIKQEVFDLYDAYAHWKVCFSMTLYSLISTFPVLYGMRMPVSRVFPLNSLIRLRDCFK